MATLKHADRFINAFNKAQDAQLEPQAQEKLGTQVGKRIAVTAIKDAGGCPSPKDALAHLMARRPDLFKVDKAAKNVEEKVSTTNGAAVA